MARRLIIKRQTPSTARAESRRKDGHSLAKLLSNFSGCMRCISMDESKRVGLATCSTVLITMMTMVCLRHSYLGHERGKQRKNSSGTQVEYDALP